MQITGGRGMGTSPNLWFEMKQKGKHIVQFINHQVKQKKMATGFALFSAAICVGVSPEYTSAEELAQVHHIYFDQNYVTTVHSLELYDQIIQQEIDAAKRLNPDYEFTLANQVKIVEETTLFSNLNEEAATEAIKEAANIEAVTRQIVVNDKVIANLKTDADLQAAIKAFTAKFIEDENDNLSFEGNVIFRDGTAAVEEIVTASEAVNAMREPIEKVQYYTVKEGDIFGIIANSNGLTIKELSELNGDVDPEAILSIGQKLKITKETPSVTVVVRRTIKESESIPYEVEYRENDKMDKGETKVVQEGSNGARFVTYDLVLKNGEITWKKEVSEQVTKEPVKKIVEKGTKVNPSRGTGQLIWPAGGYVSSEYGYRWGKLHKGIDLAGSGMVRAADHGVVSYAGDAGDGYGNKIIIDHNNGLRTLYAHLASIDVSVGQIVGQGQHIGVKGSTGYSTGIHLHFEVHVNGAAVNPRSYL